MTEREDRSVGVRMLAMLRWTKTSPGLRPRMVVSGTRESEQPIQRILGDWPLERVGRRSGFSLARLAAQAWLDLKMDSMCSGVDAGGGDEELAVWMRMSRW